MPCLLAAGIPSAGEDLNLSCIYYHEQQIASSGSAPGHPLSCLSASAILSAGEDLNLSRIYYHAQEIAFFGSAPGHPMPCLLAAAIPSSGEDLDLSRIYYHAQQIASLACGRRTHSASHRACPKTSPERAPILHASTADSRQFHFTSAGYLLWKRDLSRTSPDAATA